MIFQDNVIKEYLKNVYFITGTPCGGKTTVSRALAEKYGFELFDVDERFDEHKKMSNPLFQPAMQRFLTSFRIQMYLLNLELDLWQENIIKNLSLVILCLMEAM